MLYYLDELLTAMRATPGRRRPNLISGVVLIVIAGVLFLAGAPFPVFVAFFLRFFLSRHRSRRSLGPQRRIGGLSPNRGRTLESAI